MGIFGKGIVYWGGGELNGLYADGQTIFYLYEESNQS